MGYSPESSKILTKLHSELVQKMLQSFPDEEMSILQFRREVFFDLLQNNSDTYRTHSGVFSDLVDEALAPRKLNPLPLTDITNYLKTTLNMYLDNSGERPGLVLYDLIHDSDNNVLEFAHNVLLPLMEELGIENLPEREPMVDFGDGSDVQFPIAERIIVEGNVKFGTETETERALLRGIYDKFDEFAKANPNMKVNDLKLLVSDADTYTNLVRFLNQEVKMLEFGNMYAAVPGTEGVRTNVHIAQTLLDSIDEIAPSLSGNQINELSQLIDEFDMQDFIGHQQALEQDFGKTKLKISDYVDVTDTPAVDKTKRIQFIKDKLAQYVDDFVEQANAYLTSSDDLIPTGFSEVTYRRGMDAKQFRETFKVGFVESGIVDIEILLKNSADPVGFLHSLHDAHAAGNVTLGFPPFVSEKLLASLNKKFGLNTAGMLNTSKFLAQYFEGLTIAELAAEVFDYPNRPDFANITPIFNKLEKYDNLIDETGSIEGFDTPTNVDGNLTEYAVDDVTRKQDMQVPEEAFGKGFKTVDVPGPKKVATLEIDGILHARPIGRLGRILQNSPENLYLMTPDGLVEANTLNVLKLGKGPFEVFTYDLADAPTAFQYLEENAGLFYTDDVALDEVSMSVKKPFNPRGVEFGPVDELDKAITSSDGVENLNKAKAVIRNNPGVFRKVLNVVEKLDIGDQVIQQVLKRAFPRIGLSALAGPVGIAYALYETALLLSDVGNAVYQQQTTDESFWENFGEVSDKYSIAYKIGKPVYDTLFEAVKADLEDDDTLYLLGR